MSASIVVILPIAVALGALQLAQHLTEIWGKPGWWPRWLADPERAAAEVLQQLVLMGKGVFQAVMVLVGIGVLAFVIQLLGCRWGRLRVFIAYWGGRKAVLESIKDGLESSGQVEILLLNFDPGRPHDHVIRESQKLLRRCHAVVAIPCPSGKTTFASAEIFAASVLQRPIIIVRHEDGQILPDTVYAGYPVVDHRLLGCNYAPVVRLLAFCCRHWRDVIRSPGRMVSAARRAEVPRMGIIAVLTLWAGSAVVIAEYAPLHHSRFMIVPLTVSLLIAVLVLAVLTLGRAAVDAVAARRAARQSIEMRGFTRNAFARAVGDLRVDREMVSYLVDQLPTAEPRPKQPLADCAAEIEKWFSVLGFPNLRARADEDFIIVESGPVERARVRLQFRQVSRDDWRVHVRSRTGWEATHLVGPLAAMVIAIRYDFVLTLFQD